MSAPMMFLYLVPDEQRFGNATPAWNVVPVPEIVRLTLSRFNQAWVVQRRFYKVEKVEDRHPADAGIQVDAAGNLYFSS